MPCLVYEMRVGAHRVDLYTEAFEILVFVGHVLKLCRAHKGEIGRVEEEYCPFAEHILVGHCLELAIVIGLYLELGDVRVDYRFHTVLFGF